MPASLHLLRLLNRPNPAYRIPGHRGCSSVVERHVANVNVEGSTPFTRFRSDPVSHDAGSLCFCGPARCFAPNPHGLPTPLKPVSTPKSDMRFLLACVVWMTFAVAPALACVQQTRPTTRPQAPCPPPAGALKVVIDADVANEIDDQYAIALALGMPQGFTIEGFVAAHFGDAGGHAPHVDHDLRYDFTKDNGPIVRLYHVETEPTFDLLEQALRRVDALGEKK